LPPSLREWLAEDHLAWFVIDAVEELDLGAFYGDYRDDGWGRAAQCVRLADSRAYCRLRWYRGGRLRVRHLRLRLDADGYVYISRV
jgi:hypothetical protein